MWSTFYLYYNIRSDNGHSKHLSTKTIIKVLENTGVLKNTGPQKFVNKETFPWIEICCVNAINGNYSFNNNDSTELCNLISVVASKRNPAELNKYVRLLTQVAEYLNWELSLEEDDDGNEDVILYRP